MLNVKYKMLGEKGTIFVLITFAILHLPFNIAQAASLSFEPEAISVQEGQSFSINLMLDPEGEDVNAIELELDYADNILSFVSAPTGKSIISLWVESPRAKGKEIRMAGIMPGGFSGFIDVESNTTGPGVVVGLVFKPLRHGTGSINIKSAKVIKNDGSGGLVNVKTKGATISVISARADLTGEVDAHDYDDDDLPDIFTPSIISSKHLFDGKKVLIFHTNDASSGIEHYEVREGEGEYRRAESPYLLEDQTLKGIIYVRAIDFAGNARTIAFDPRESKNDNGPRSYFLVPSLIVVCSLSFIIFIASWLARKKNPYT